MDVAGCVTRDQQRLENRHAGSEQSAERAGETADRRLEEERAHSGRVQKEPIHRARALAGAVPGFEGEHARDHDTNRDDDLVLDEITHGKHRERENRHRLPLQHVRENLLELRNHEHHQRTDDGHGDKHDDHRVGHGGLHLALDLLGFLHEPGQTFKHRAEHAARLAGLHHVHIKAVEHLGVLQEAVGEIATGADALDERLDNFLELRVFLLAGERLQTAHDGHAGVDERGQLAGEHREAGLVDDAPKGHAAAFLFLGGGAQRLGRSRLARVFFRGGPGGGAAFGSERGGDEAHRLEFDGGLFGSGAFNDAFLFFARGRLDGAISEFWHRVRVSYKGLMNDRKQVDTVNDQVYLMISSMEVAPSKMARRPSSRSVRIPCSRAFCLMTIVEARSTTRSRTASLMRSHS